MSSPRVNWVGLLLLATIAVAASGCMEWRETYEADEDIPYGLDLLPGVLQARFADADYRELGRAALADGELAKAQPGELYVAVAPGLTYTEPELAELYGFAARGGHVLLSARVFDNVLLDTFDIDSCSVGAQFTEARYSSDDVRLITARGDTLGWPIRAEVIGQALLLNYMRRHDECLPHARDLLVASGLDSSNSNLPGVAPWMVRHDLGSGTVDLLSVPVALTNVYLTEPRGRAVVDEILSYYPEAVGAVHYDRDRYASEARVEQLNRRDDGNGGGGQNAESLLEYVLTRPALAAAWYALLAGLILFVALGARRRQRVVPLVQPRRNTTHDHLQNISRLYLAHPDNLLMTRKQLTLFESYCTRRFGLAPLRDADDRAKFLRMQGVDERDVETLVRYRNSVQREEHVSDGGLVRLVRILQSVYRDLGRLGA